MVKFSLMVIALFTTLFSFTLPTVAQETRLVPFTDEAFAVQGVIPEGWTSMGSGIYVRSTSPDDLALVAIQSAAMAADDLMQALLPQLGLDDVPESVGTSSTEAFEWTLYQFDVEQGEATARVDLALTEQDGTTYLALMQASIEEYETLHAEVFVPMLDALAPLELVDEQVPYQVEEVTFTNGDVTLAGTLTLPQSEGQHPAVVLMTGSGPQDRDEMTLPGYRIFAQIADYLTRQGIAVLRYDDRGVGESTGDFAATSVYEFADDGKAAIAYLQARDDINAEQVGVLGHSEGGIYASMLGADPDSGVAFIITLAGSTVLGQEVLLHQNELVLRTAGASEEFIAAQLEYLNASFPLVAARDWDAVEQLTVETILLQWDMLTDEEQEVLGGDAESYAQMQAASFRQGYAVEWYATMLEYDPAPDWAQTTVPVLAIYGGVDVQVDEAQNAVPLAEALVAAGNRDFAIVVLPNMNHLLQEAVTGGVEEYATLRFEVMPDLLSTVAEWLRQRVDVVG